MYNYFLLVLTTLEARLNALGFIQQRGGTPLYPVRTKIVVLSQGKSQVKWLKEGQVVICTVYATINTFMSSNVNVNLQNLDEDQVQFLANFFEFNNLD